MKENFKYIVMFLIALMTLIAIIIILKGCNEPIPEPLPPLIHIDTVWKVVPREPVNIDSVKATVKIRPHVIYTDLPVYITILDTIHDTVYYSTPAFSACMDTILSKDTMGVEFRFPEMNFYKFYFNPKPDSIKEIIKTVTIQLPVTFWQKAEYSMYGTLVGILAGGALGIYLGSK